MIKIYIGIDIGSEGAISVLRDGQIDEIYKMPWAILSRRNSLDVDAFFTLMMDICNTYDPSTIMVERASMHLQSQKVASSMWFSYGLLLSVIKRTGVRYIELDNKKWQKEFSIKGDTKKQSISVCESLFPSLELRFEKQNKTTKNHNISDAVLIAEYGRRLNL